MITETYIKMCEQAEELQREWKPKDFDTFYWVKDKEIGVAMADGGHTKKEMEENLKYQFWLPTLEQLFGKWCNLCQATNFAGLCQRIIEHGKSKVVSYSNIKFIKELCLETIMKEFYHKSWTGETWEVIKPEIKKTCGNCKHYMECTADGEGIDTIHPDNEDCGEWEATK